MLKSALFGLAAVVSLASAGAQAAEVKKFDETTLAQAQAAGRPVLVDVKAWWCPVCASQNRKIKEITSSPAYDKLLILEINYDGQKDEWRKLGVRKQATLIGYKGAKEVGRVEFRTDKDEIAQLLSRTVG